MQLYAPHQFMPDPSTSIVLLSGLLHAVTFRVRPAGPHHLRIRAMMCNLQDIRSLIWGATSSVTGGWDV